MTPNHNSFAEKVSTRIDPDSPFPADYSQVKVPPPLLFAGTLLAGLLLQKRLPLPRLPGRSTGVAGMIILGLGSALIAWSLDLFRRARTSPIPQRPSSALVIAGPYKFTRNPMYLGMLGIYLGISLTKKLLWPLLLAPALIALVNRSVIVKEETYLARKFGGDYAGYKTRVRRWI